MPFPRAAAGAGVAGRRIVVAGGVGEGRRLAQDALVLDLRTHRWSVVPGPTPREHLGVTSLAGVVYAVGGRTAGLDTNLLHFESFRPGDRSWKRLHPVPDARGGTGAAGVAGQIVSVGGEEPGGTIAEVMVYRVAEGRWVRSDDLPTPPRRRCRRVGGPRVRDRRRPRAGSHGELCQRGSARLRAIEP